MENIIERVKNGKFTLVAEIGVNYYDIAKEQNITPMEAAKLMVKEAKEAGVHAVKFQTYKAETLAAKKSPYYWDIKEEPTKGIVLQEEFIPKISCPSLYNTITKTVIAQDEQIKQILIALKKHYLSEDNKMKANILMAGPTGTGKTEILTQIAKQINVPIAILDSTQFTQEGYVGRSVDQAIKQLYDNADRDINKAKKGILVFDEIDKKASSERETIATKAVLDSLLKIMDGTDYYVPNLGSINTSKMVFVGSGAFSKIVPDFEKEIGFNNQINKKTSYKENVNVDSFIKYGLSPEFIGRINELVLLNDLSINDLVKEQE